MRTMLTLSLLGAGLLLAAPALAEEMNNLKWEDLEQIEQEQAKAAAPATEPATSTPAPAETAPAAQ